MKNSVDVTGKNANGETITVVVKRPTPKQESQAKIYSNKVFADAINNQALLRAKLVDYMIKQGLWSDEQEDELNKLVEAINDGVKKLRKGGCKLSEAKRLALEIKDNRIKHSNLIMQRRSLDEFTAEGQAENAHFDYLCSVCILKEDGQPMFSSVDDYLKNADCDVIVLAATELAELTSGLDADWEKKLPENEFLIKYKFANEKLQYINEDGKLITREGRLIDEEGRYIDEEGNYINYSGEPVDKDGELIIEFTEFEDDVYTKDNTQSTVTSDKSGDTPDAPSADIPPKDTLPEDPPLQDISPKDSTPQDVTPQDGIPQDLTPQDVTLKSTMAGDIKSEDSQFQNVQPKDISTKLSG